MASADQSYAEANCTKVRIVHRALCRSLQSIIDTAPQVLPKQQKQFLVYCDTFCQSLHHHHNLEDTIMFPALATICGVLDEVARLESEHDDIDPLVYALRMILQAPTYDGKAVAKAAAALQARLLPHLEFEESIFTREVMARAGEQRLREMDARIMASGQLPDLFTKLPFAVSNMTKEEADLVFFDHAPWFLGKVMYPLLFARRHKSVWRKFGARPAASPQPLGREPLTEPLAKQQPAGATVQMTATMAQTLPAQPAVQQDASGGLLPAQQSTHQASAALLPAQHSSTALAAANETTWCYLQSAA